MSWLLAILLTGCPLICVAQQAKSPYIRQGDVLRISVRGEPDISRVVVVQADGFIAMPLLNEVGVVGLTVQEVQKLLVERLQRFVANPEVTVSIEGKLHFRPNVPMLQGGLSIVAFSAIEKPPTPFNRRRLLVSRNQFNCRGLWSVRVTLNTVRMPRGAPLSFSLLSPSQGLPRQGRQRP